MEHDQAQSPTPVLASRGYERDTARHCLDGAHQPA